ncbi:MAG TPA: hypothetical protein VF595_09475 [Tepidisphaeraceae bacterium]|jgi:hypothetical protein
MIFSVAIILIVLGVTYIHYLQGAFTAAISAACALAATLVAFGYFENAINSMSQTGFSDYAAGMSLLVIFAITYLVLRIGADALVPGNIALQLYVEKAGSIVFGVVAGLLCAGTFAIGVQMMPMGAAVYGYAPYEVESERPVAVPATMLGKSRAIDTFVYNEVVPEKLANPSSLLLPADSLVLSLVKVTSGGSLSGAQSFAAIHPDLPTEAFATRIGAETSGKHVILNTAKQTNVTLTGLYTLPATITALDTEVSDLRPKKLNLTFKPSTGEQLLAVRVTFNDAAADKDAHVRFTPAAARLVIDGETYYPIGTMEGASHIGLNRIDDMIPVQLQSGFNGVDLVYALPKSAADALAKPAAEDAVRFVELKLFGRMDLSGKKVEPYPGASKTIKLARKPTSPLGLTLRPAAAPTP